MNDARPEPPDHRVFTNRTLRASRFIGCDLAEVVVRGSEVAWPRRQLARPEELVPSLVAAARCPDHTLLRTASRCQTR